MYSIKHKTMIEIHNVQHDSSSKVRTNDQAHTEESVPKGSRIKISVARYGKQKSFVFMDQL